MTNQEPSFAIPLTGSQKPQVLENKTTHSKHTGKDGEKLRETERVGDTGKYWEILEETGIDCKHWKRL